MRTGNETPSNIENSDNSMGAGTLQGRSREIISQAVGETTSQSLGRRHRVQEGETLRTIARDYLGNARRSAEIVTMNPDLLENERTPLQAGQILRMPADSTDDQSQ
jgi:hypothetical protein